MKYPAFTQMVTVCVASTMLTACSTNVGAVPPGSREDGSAALRLRQPFVVLYNFRGGSDGAQPQGPLILGKDGALYGTTEFGGSSYSCGFYHNSGCGTVFKLSPSRSAYTERVVHSFRGLRSDGAWPWAGLTFDSNGALYGTTTSDEGAKGCGTAFKLTPTASGYSESAVYKFEWADCNRGERPYAGLIFGKDGALYGTTFVGDRIGEGLAFRLTPSGFPYTETILQRFHGLNGLNPFAGLTFGTDGALYGTTSAGGSTQACGFYYDGCGTVFKLTPSGRSRYRESVIHNFVESDGEGPFGGVIFDNKGALYGTTGEGGSGTCSGSTGCGTVFKLTRSGSGYIETVLYSFAGSYSSDGQYPMDTLVLDNEGALYGTTYWGGSPSCNCGTVFKLTPSGSGYKESILHRFAGADGAEPRAALIFDRRGALYGTASAGGKYGEGTVFKVAR